MSLVVVRSSGFVGEESMNASTAEATTIKDSFDDVQFILLNIKSNFPDPGG